MTLRLTVDTAAWRRHVDAVVATVDGLVPVVKGNGYGFGRLALARLAAGLADTIAVGTVHELDVLDVLDATAHPSPDGSPIDAPSAVPGDVVVLTPTLAPPAVAPERILLTVGAAEHVDALAGWPGRVLVKVATSMSRYGGDVALLERARSAGLTVAGWALHPPLAGTDQDRVAEIAAWLPHLDPALEVWLSHLSPTAYRTLPDTHRYRLRMGTGLWHADKSTVQLGADVLAVRPVAAGHQAGYRLDELPGAGTVVMVGAGSAHGVAPLPDGRSPFHHRRRRVALVEPPHMHTSMLFVPAGDPVPAIGELVDVQRPLITAHPDVIDWA